MESALNEESTLVFSLRQPDWGLARFPFATLFEELDAFETFQDGAFAADGGIGLEAIVLGHLRRRIKSWDAETRKPSQLWQSKKAGNMNYFFPSSNRARDKPILEWRREAVLYIRPAVDGRPR